VLKVLGYVPIFLMLIRYCIRYKSSPAILTNINPSFLKGGLFGAKSMILEKFQKKQKTYEEFFVKTALIKKTDIPHKKITIVQNFITTNHLSYPIIIKPDR